MVQRVDDTLDVSAETAVHIVFVCFLTGVWCAVVRCIAVHEAVGHNQIHYVGRSETLTLATTGPALSYDIVIGSGFLAFLERDTIGTRLEYAEVHKQVVRTLGVVLTANNQSMTCPANEFAIHHLLYTYLRIVQVLAVKHHRQWCLHVRPPAQRLYLFDFGIGVHHLTHQQHSCKQNTFSHTILIHLRIFYPWSNRYLSA